MTTTDLITVDPEMAVLEDLTTGQNVLLPERPLSVVGLTIDENLTCVDNEFADNDCVIALYHVTRKPNGDWLIPNPDLPCLVNDEEVSNKVLLSQGTVVHAGDRFMRYHMPVSRRKSAGAPPKPSRMRSNSLIPIDVSTPKKTNHSFSITMADEWCIIDIGNEISTRQERLRNEGWCVIGGTISSDPLIEAITSAEQLCSIVSSHICHQTMVYTDTPLSTHEIDDLFKYIKAMGPGNEMVMTKFVLEYHSHMSEEENMGRALHRPVIALLTEFLKLTLEPLEQTEFWLRLLASYTDVRDNLVHFLELGTTPVVLGAMAAYMASEKVEANGCRVLANVSSVLPNHNKKGPIRESAVELVLMAVRVHMSNAEVIRPACRTLANVTQTYATLIGRVLTPEADDTNNDENNAIDNLARWLGIMEVIQEYGLPIIEVLTNKYNDVIIQAECRRVVAFFLNNSFQTDLSDDSTTDLPHLEMGMTQSEPMFPSTPSDSTRSSISSLSPENDDADDAKAINKVINQVMMNCSNNKQNSISEDQTFFTNGRVNFVKEVVQGTIPVITVTDEITAATMEVTSSVRVVHETMAIPVITVTDETAIPTVEVTDEVKTEVFEKVIQEARVTNVMDETAETAKKGGSSKKEKRFGWKWFTSLFSAKDDEVTSELEKDPEKDIGKDPETYINNKPKFEKVTKNKTLPKNYASEKDHVDDTVDLDHLVKKNLIYADMVESFEELYRNYANEEESDQFTNIDLNNDNDAPHNYPAIENSQPSTKFVSLQRQRFSLERQKQRLKTLKSVAKGIVKMSKKDKYTVNDTDSVGNVYDNRSIPNAQDSVLPSGTVTTLDVKMTSSEHREEEIHEENNTNQSNEPYNDVSGLKNISDSGTSQPSTQSDVTTDNLPEYKLPSVTALKRLFERRKSDEIITISNPKYSRLRQRSEEIRFERSQRQQSGSGAMLDIREASEVTMDGNEGMSSSSDHIDYYEQDVKPHSAKDIRRENDLVESGEVRVFVTEKDVQIPGGIGASKC